MVEIRAADRPLPPQTIKTPVLQLASGGLVSKMKELGCSELHTTNKWGGALHYAVSNDHAAAARWLLEQGVGVDGRTVNGHTALHIAAHFGHGTLVDVLLAASASPDAVDKQGRAPLHLAVQEGHAASVEVRPAPGPRLVWGWDVGVGAGGGELRSGHEENGQPPVAYVDNTTTTHRNLQRLPRGAGGRGRAPRSCRAP